ncbi:phosphonate ABC transporter ATPase [Gracilibacillus halophilus YIM-C55.5]|uniref:Phosphonate ABC transporter ATPase n=1 Tax=Gracilibacillus halophilus YIM-C55.5 TaxID=1308866 RepID=N4WHD9_9BACI|nr:phosphonate ABC transporter ATP-binding protein [Gracilibacillus halophilus]ENH95592.1 phosphonate ABC transporter ATPase [Gracilibacillus halophilus YIM-C55.5]
MALLELFNLSKRYDQHTIALSDINISVNKGEFIAVIGPSGAGKSTLLRCINRMIEPTNGEVTFDGVDLLHVKRKELRRLRTKIGMIFQHYHLVNRLTVIENVLHGRLGYKSSVVGALGIYTKKEKEQAIQLLRMLGLADQMYKRSDKLSGGQKQRVGIARALIQDPKMLLCDEPIASLDPNASKIIMDYLQKISQSLGITVIVNLHQVDVALQYSDRIIGVSQGQIVYDGTPTDITQEQIHQIYGSDFDDLMVEMNKEKHYAG